MNPLTWYPGTILPYTSLWHILLRATWLNDLRADDIRQLYKPRASSRGEKGRRDIRMVTSLLGEPSNALSKFAVLEQFPSNLRYTCMEEKLRWCPLCMAAGFHTLLGCIKLVAYCPVHGVPLIRACRECGEEFSMRFGGLTAPKRHCNCGRTVLLTPGRARQPRLRPVDVAAWEPVARWVKQVSHVTCSASPNIRLSPEIYLALTARWCRDLAISYPTCFADESVLWPSEKERARWSSYQAASGDLTETVSSQQPTDSSLPQGSPSCWVYRAMARHLRRHVVANPDRWIKSLMSSLDPATFAKTMAHYPKASMAFTEMLWARRLEPNAVRRRWSARASPLSADPARPWAHFTSIELQIGIGSIRFGGPPLSATARKWTDYHAMALEARHAWDRAWEQTLLSISDGWANWEIENWGYGSDPAPGRVVWFCKSKGRGLIFAGYIRDALSTPFPSDLHTHSFATGTPKHSHSDRRRLIESLACLNCLSWNCRDGWQVELGASPDDDDVRRVALLHCGQPTACWIFKSNQRFVARLDGGIIQASGATAREALCGLRGAVIQYRRMYDATHAMKTPRQLDSHAAALSTTDGKTSLKELFALSFRGSVSDYFWAGAALAHHMGVSRLHSKAGNGIYE